MPCGTNVDATGGPRYKCGHFSCCYILFLKHHNFLDHYVCIVLVYIHTHNIQKCSHYFLIGWKVRELRLTSFHLLCLSKHTQPAYLCNLRMGFQKENLIFTPLYLVEIGHVIHQRACIFSQQFISVVHYFIDSIVKK